ncbi:MAG: endolytic transglycosylase MltG [Alistipes sp.]|nr:endolytic transglycosylase MltG [Alistipes sp.]
MLKRALPYAAAVLSVVMACGIYCYVAFYGNCVRESGSLYIYRHYDYAQAEQSVKQHIGHRSAFDIYARRINLGQTFRAGHYRIEDGMSVVDIARMLKLGRQTPVDVVINNVRTPAELAGKLSRQIEADSVSVLRALTDDSLARSVGFDSLRLFSMFIPNTYEFYWTVEPEAFLRRMRREYDAFWTDGRDARLARCGMSRYEVMTLASILYEETKAADEMPRIAGVYMNRLRKGMPLQACPTVKYAMQDFSLRRVLRKHLRYKSPYNTYINKGLPPSPICMPSIRAIDAVLGYEEHPYIFFCARPELDGHHNFARTLKEHNANARAYAAALDKMNIK